MDTHNLELGVARAVRVVGCRWVGRWVDIIEDLSDTEGEIANESSVRSDLYSRRSVDVPGGQRLILATSGRCLQMRDRSRTMSMWHPAPTEAAGERPQSRQESDR